MCDCCYGTGFNLRNAESTFSVQSYQVMTVFGSFAVEDAGRLEHQTVSLGLWLSNLPTIPCGFVFPVRQKPKTHQQNLNLCVVCGCVCGVCVCVCVCRRRWRVCVYVWCACGLCVWSVCGFMVWCVCVWRV